MSRADLEIQVDPARLRGVADVSEIYGSFEKIQAHCHWKPKRSLEESISQMFAQT